MCVNAVLRLFVLSHLKESKIEGIGPAMSAVWARSIAAMEEAAADIGDKLAHRSHQAPMSEELGNSVLVSTLTEARSAFLWSLKAFGWISVAGLLAWLSSYHVSADGMLSNSLEFAAVWSVFACATATMVLLVQLGDLRTGKATVRKVLLANSARMWALGDKAIYSATENDVQVIRIDAIGSVVLKDDKVLVRSRFGEPTVILSSGDMDKDVLGELVASLKARIQ